MILCTSDMPFSIYPTLSNVSYSSEEICMCYNGGKDCLAVLHLTYALMRQKYPDIKLQAVYITEDKAFPQVTEFVQQSINRWEATKCDFVDS